MPGALFLFASTDAIEPGSPSALAVKKVEKYYREKHERIIKRSKEAGIDLLFIGDSITEHWLDDGRVAWDSAFGKWKPGNFGLSGDTTYGVQWRIEHGALDNLHPRVAVLLIGTNDLSVGETPETTAANIGKVVRKIKEKLPDAKVIVLGILPRARARDEIRQELAAVNSAVSKLDNGKDVLFVDIGKEFLDAAGEISAEIMPDSLHLSGRGYQVFADALKPVLSKHMDTAVTN